MHIRASSSIEDPTLARESTIFLSAPRGSEDATIKGHGGLVVQYRSFCVVTSLDQSYDIFFCRMCQGYPRRGILRLLLF